MTNSTNIVWNPEPHPSTAEKMKTCMVCGDIDEKTWGLCVVCVEAVRYARTELLKSLREMIE